MQPDSTAVAGIIAPAIHGWLAGTFADLSPQVLDGLTKLGTTAGTIAALTMLRWAMIGFAKASTIGRTYAAPIWDRNKGWLNPLLAIVLGHFDGSALAGALAVAVHAGYRGAAKAVGNATPQGVAKAARVSALVLAALLACGTARAGVADLLRPATKPLDPPVSAFALQRFALQLGVGAQAGGWVYSRGTTGFVEAQAAYQWTNALGLRVGVRRMAVARAPLQPEARLTLTIAP